MEDGIEISQLQVLEAEKAVLGSLLLNWDAMGESATALKADRFYSNQNRVIYECMVKLYKENVRGDIITVVTTLEESGTISNAGGRAYISSLTSSVPTTANLDFYISLITDRAIRRDLIKASIDISKSAFDMSLPGNQVLEEAEKNIFALSDLNTKSTIYEIKNLVDSSMDSIERSIGQSKELTGVGSGFVRLDNMTSGFQKSEMIIIGARPSIGKTALALSMMEHIAIDEHVPCGFFSLEMSRQAIVTRLLSQRSKVPNSRLRANVSKDDFDKLKKISGDCYNAPLYIVDTPNMQLLDLRSMARRMVLNYNVEIIFIDYIGLISTEHPEAPVYETQSLISKSLKGLARELEVPIVALCQVARDAEGKEPSLAQLRGSGSIEQDADVVMFLHRERLNTDTPEGEDEGLEAKCIIAKQRNGATGVVDLLFFPKYTKFTNKAMIN